MEETLKKFFVILLVVFLVSTTLFASGKKEEVKKNEEVKTKTLLLSGVPGIDDKSFNAAAWKGILEFYEDNGEGRGTKYQAIEIPNNDEFTSALKSACEEDYDVIVTTGFT